MGVDIIILTQNPMLLDRNVLALVGRHLHIRRFGGVGAALVYEWDHCSRQLMYSKALKKSPFRYDKSVFKLYKSAELHTKPKTSIPPLVYAVGAALIGAAFFIPNTIDRIASKGEKVTAPAKTEAGAVAPSVGIPGVPAAPSGTGQGGQPYDPTAFIPRVSYEPLSAPAYDNIRQVVVMPVIVGGACFKGECRCFTAQGSDAGLSHAECLRWIKSPPFDPYRVQQAATSSPVAPGETAGARTPSAPAQNVPAPALTAAEPRFAGGVSNPLVDMRHEQRIQPREQAQQEPPMGGVPANAPTLQSPYRRG
jgi:zona occludens toxin